MVVTRSAPHVKSFSESFSTAGKNARTEINFVDELLFAVPQSISIEFNRSDMTVLYRQMDEHGNESNWKEYKLPWTADTTYDIEDENWSRIRIKPADGTTVTWKIYAGA